MFRSFTQVLYYTTALFARVPPDGLQPQGCTVATVSAPCLAGNSPAPETQGLALVTMPTESSRHCCKQLLLSKRWHLKAQARIRFLQLNLAFSGANR